VSLCATIEKIENATERIKNNKINFKRSGEGIISSNKEFTKGL
jgi:hypothetical protein